MEIVVSKANLDDIEGLIHVYNSDGLKHARELETYPLHEWIMDQKYSFNVAKVSRKPVGFLFTRRKGDEAKIDMFSVAKKYKGKGVEKKLLEAAEKAEEVPKITTYIPKSDKTLLTLFKKQGYIVYNEVKELFGDKENGLYLIKNVARETATRRKRLSKSERAARSFLDENLGKLDIYLKP